MGLYSITTRAEGTVLTGAGSSSDIFNVDHQNHVTHTEPESINSWEASATQMNLETDPAPGGTVSLASSLSDELERLRFVLSGLKASISAGTRPAHWYTETETFSAFITLPIMAGRLERAATVTIPNNHSTTIAFDTVIYNTFGTDTLPSNSALKAPVSGIYICGGCASLDNVSGDFRLRLARSGTGIAEENTYSGATSAPKALTAETIAHFDADQILQMAVLQSSGTPQDMSTTILRPSLWMALVAR